MPQLDNYLVTLGVKGQNIVLAQMDKIHKKGSDLSKKKTKIDLAANQTLQKESAKTQKAIEKKISLSDKSGKKKDDTIDKNAKKRNDEEKKNNSKFGKSVDKFGSSTANAAHTMARLDPAAAIGGGLGALAKMSIVGIPFAIAEAALGMATNTISMAKSTISEQHGLTQRNVTAGYYGEKVKQTDRVSNAEQSALRMTIAGTFGKIQQPLADAVNKLSTGKENYNTAALARVASGNWQSTGTDKGWMIQKLADSFQGLPPSIAQKFQASLLDQYGAGEIQKATTEESNVQRTNAKFQNFDEEQTAAVYGAIQNNMKDILELNAKLKGLQVDMVKAGAAVAGALNFVAGAISKASGKMNSSKVGK